MNVEQRAVRFPCHDDTLYGVLSISPQGSQRGVLIVVGGPQYRAGSHRQFALLARFLAENGVSVMRFDYRGMGDSEGEARTFEDIGDDIRCAIDQFQVQVPQVREVVIWGLCDAASAALFYAHSDPRVTGLVLLNPWVRTEQGAARAYLKHYYVQRLFSREFWSKTVRFRLDVAGSLRSLAQTVSVLPRKTESGRPPSAAGGATDALPERMLRGLKRFQGRVLIILSGNDLTAKEFVDCTKASREWSTLLALPRVTIRHLPDANHTFARQDWRNQVASWTRNWLGSW